MIKLGWRNLGLKWPRGAWRASVGLIGLCLISTALVGCMDAKGAPSPSPVRPVLKDADGEPMMWQPYPAYIRIFPSTRFLRERDKNLLEARVEVLDGMGDAFKSSGRFRFELFAFPEGQSQVGALLYAWTVRLETREHQLEHYDPITRGYRFQLKLDNLEASAKRTLLKVRFSPPGQPILEHQAEVLTGW